MPAIPLNPNKQLRGMLPGNYAGNIWATWNIDLERHAGRISLADKLRRYVSGLGVVEKFIRTDATTTDQWWGLVLPTTSSATDGDILRNGNSTITAGTWITDDTAGAGDASPNNVHDMVIHELANGEQRLLVSTAVDIAALNSAGLANVWDINWGSTIASGGITLQNTVYHQMARLQRLVAVSDKITGIPVIHTIDKSDVFSSSRLSFDADYTVRLIITSSNRFWFGLEHNLDGNAKIVEWDGFSLTYNNEYNLIGSVPLTGFIINNIPYFITEKGYIFGFTGGSFEPIASFNIDEDRMVFETARKSETGISPYGSFVDGNNAYLNVGIPMIIPEATTFSRGTRRARSGIWIFNSKNRNLYQSMGIGEHATAGTDVNYGCGHMDSIGAIIKAIVATDKILIASASVFTGGATWRTSTTNGIYRMIENTLEGSNTGRNRGYFITPYMPIEEATAIYNGIWVKFKRFLNSANRIVVKWRARDPLTNTSAQDPDGNENKLYGANGTWASTTTFTCKVPTGVAVNDEVEILTGDNGGCSFRISALSATPDNTTSITVTIEEAAPTSSTDTFLCRFDNWETETAISSTTRGSQHVPFTAGSGKGEGEFIQLKIELRGFGVEIDDILPTYKINTELEK